MGPLGSFEGHTAQAVFTVVAPVDPTHASQVRQLLVDMAADPAGNDTLPLGEIPGLHYASLVLHEHIAERPLLVLEANVDGTSAAMLGHLVDTCRDGVEALWSHCDGYPGTGAGSDAQLAYLRRHIVLPGAYHVGTTGRSSAQIAAEAELHEAIATFVDDQRAAGTLPDTSLGVRDAIVAHLRRQPHLTWALSTPAPESLGARLRRAAFLFQSSDRRVVAPALLAVTALAWATWRWPLRTLLATGATVAVVAVAFRRLEARESADDHPVPDELVDGIEGAEDRPGVVTNHLASLVDIKPHRRVLLRVVLLVIDVAARVTYTKGQLGGIPSIHFAHWSVVDDGRRLLFVSNYDGSWESYLDDFIEKAASGLSAVWSNTADFPRARWLGIFNGTGGARRGPEFKRMARNSQSPTTIHHCAYPELSVTNVLDNAALRRGLIGTMDEEQAWAWLSRL